MADSDDESYDSDNDTSVIGGLIRGMLRQTTSAVRTLTAATVGRLPLTLSRNLQTNLAVCLILKIIFPLHMKITVALPPINAHYTPE